MKQILSIVLVFFSLNVLAGSRIDQDVVKIGKKGSSAEKQIKFFDQFIIKTPSTTGPLLLSTNSGADFSPLLTASIGVGGGGSGLITLTASPSINLSISNWIGSGGDSLGQGSITINLENTMIGVASISMSASLTIGTASSYLYVDAPGNMRCSGDAGGTTEILCGPDVTGASGVDPQCHIRLEGGNGSGSDAANDNIKRFTSTAINDCAIGSVSMTNSATRGAIFEIVDPGIYAIVCALVVTSNVGIGLSLNAIPNGDGGDQYFLVDISRKIASSTPRSVITGDARVSTIRRFVQGDEITCHWNASSDLQASRHYYYIERIE